MNAHATKAPQKSEARVELEQLLGRIGESTQVRSLDNGNGHWVIAQATRKDKRVVRVYVEGASSLANAELVVLAALRSMLGVRS